MSGAGQQGRALVFVRDGRARAVDERSVRGVLATPEVTPVPSAPPEVLGLLAWRGAAVALVEVGEAVERRAVRAAVVVATEHGPLALAADRVLGWQPDAGEAAALDPEAVYRVIRRAVRRRTATEALPGRS